MTSIRRPRFLSRLVLRSHNTRSRRCISAHVDHFSNLHCTEHDNDDAASVHSILPPYSPRSNLHYLRPSSPTPTYHSVDVSDSSSPTDDTPSQQPRLRSEQAIIDECVTRISESIVNPRAWRRLGGGTYSYFWALRCAPGTADILSENIDEIRNRILGSSECTVAQFRVILKGQKLVELWCRPAHSKVFFHRLRSRTDVMVETWHSRRPLGRRLYYYSCVSEVVQEGHSGILIT